MKRYVLATLSVVLLLVIFSLMAKAVFCSNGDGESPVASFVYSRRMSTAEDPTIVGVLWFPPATYYLTVETDPVGIATILGQGPYTEYTNVTLTAPPYVNVSTDTRYRFNYWDVDGASQSSGVNPITVFMDANHTATAHYATQYSLTFSQTGLSSDATGTIATVDSNPENYTQLPFTLWVDSGDSVTYSYSSTVSASTAGKQFGLNTVSGPSSPIYVSGATTVTGNYVAQYQVTFAQSGLDSTANGTVVTVNWNSKEFGDLPFTVWADDGSSVTYSYSNVSSSTVGKGFILTSVGGPSSPLNVTSPVTVTGNYNTQYAVAFGQSGVGADFTDTVVTVDGIDYNLAGLTVQFWWDQNSSHSFAFASPLAVNSSKQYVWGSTSGLSSLQSGTLTVNTPGGVTGNYKTQYYLTLATNPPGVASPSGAGWYDANTYANVSTAQYVDIVPGSSRYGFNNWTTSDMNEIVNSTAPATAALMDKSKTVTANFATQYSITFVETGAGSDFNGTIVTVDSTGYTYNMLNASFWWDNRSSHIFSFSSPLAASVGKQYIWVSTTGLSTLQSGSIVVSSAGNITANYKTQYYLSVVSPYATPGGQGWYDNGSIAYATLNTSVVDHGNGTRHAFTSWSGDASGTNYTQSNPITMNGPETAVANWKTQHTFTFDASGLDSSASDTVVTVNAYPITFAQLPYANWTDSGSSIAYSYNNVSSAITGKQFILIGVTGLPSPIAVTNPMNVTGNYGTQRQVTFNQTGVGSDFTGTVVTVDSNAYNVSCLPLSFWWDNGSSHAFSFPSPLVVNASEQYNWTSTSGLSALQSGNLSITNPGSVTGNYAVKSKYQITFSEAGVDTDFTGTVVTIDGVNYNLTALSASFQWDNNSIHTFAYRSPLVAIPNGTQYVWTGTAGLSTQQNDTITVTTSGNITGNYKTQYYLALATNPLGVASPSGAGWYDDNTYANMSTVQHVNITLGYLRYGFSNWTTTNMTEVINSTGSATTVLMDKSKTVTANYATQYSITFGQTGVGSDFAGTVVTIDGVNRTVADLPTTPPFWWDSGSIHSFSFASPLAADSKQYVWNSTSGLSALRNGTLTATASGNVVGNYTIQNLVIFDQAGVSSDFAGTVVIIDTVNYTKTQLPISFLWGVGSTHSFAFQTPLVVRMGAKQYVWQSTAGRSSLQSGSITVTTYGSIIGNYKTQYYLTVTSPYGTAGGQAWYDGGATAYAALNTGAVDHGNGTRRAFTSWGTDASGTNSAQSSPIAMNGPKTATADWKTEYRLTVRTEDLGTRGTSVYNGTTVLGTATDATPYAGWFEEASLILLNVDSPTVDGSATYVFTQWSRDAAGTSRPVSVTMDAAKDVTASYEFSARAFLSINEMFFIFVFIIGIVAGLTLLLMLHLRVRRRKKRLPRRYATIVRPHI